MKILKFGGKSQANGEGIENTISIIKQKVERKEPITVVLSARGNTTSDLETLLDLAKDNKDYAKLLEELEAYQLVPSSKLDLTEEFTIIENILKGVELTKDYTLKTKDLLLAQGELISIKTTTHLLALQGIKAQPVDSRIFLKTDDAFGQANLNYQLSQAKTTEYFSNLEKDVVPIVTGFIASNSRGETTTLGRNGSNFSASILADFLSAEGIESYTHIDGIFTANPEVVSSARIIPNINYNEASELASFGASILHTKSIVPLLDKRISLRILNTFNPENRGTLISDQKTPKGIKSISIQENVCLINLLGKGILGKKGVDARIFHSLSTIDINVGIISQGSSERAVSFVVPISDGEAAVQVLKEEFKYEISVRAIQKIELQKDISVVTVVGQKISNFASSLDYLKQNKIPILLINNTISGNNISLVIYSKDIKKAVNVIHSQIFGAIKTINIAIVGKGTVGSSLINQILKSKNKIKENKDIDLNIFAIAGSKNVLMNKDGISVDWKSEIEASKNTTDITNKIIAYASENHLENLVLIDNTSSLEFISDYITYIENGFDLISSNKIANTQSYNDYQALRDTLKKNKKQYLYETNVGAGLPIIDTIKMLHDSGENITRIKGVFSGSLSFLFNSFSIGDQPFSYYLKQAIEAGYTEPDPREDLSGNDVARKLLILARELDLVNEFDDIEIQNLIPEKFRDVDAETFLNNLEEVNPYFAKVKEGLDRGQVLRYIGDLHGDLRKDKGLLKVELATVSSDSALGNLQGSDSIFEIYTESYQDNPITVIGAGAGAEVTARGVFGDLLRIANKK